MQNITICGSYTITRNRKVIMYCFQIVVYLFGQVTVLNNTEFFLSLKLYLAQVTFC